MSILWGAVAQQLVFNAAAGGTEHDVTYLGKACRLHLWTTAGDKVLTITANPKPFWIRGFAGGGESGYADLPSYAGTAGGHGGGYELQTALPVGDLAMHVGASDQDTTIAGVGTWGHGGHGKRTFNNTGRSNGGAGTWGGTSTGSNGSNAPYEFPADPGAALRTLPFDDPYDIEGTWGRGGGQITNDPAPVNPLPGTPGMLAIWYEIEVA